MLFAAVLSSTLADEIVLLPSDDTSIYGGSGEENWNAGLSPQISSGARGTKRDTAPFRMLIRFDIAAQVPAGSLITKATVRLHIAKVPNGGGSASDFGFHRMLFPWIEGTIFAGNSGGAEVINPGEPTWLNRAHPDAPWAAPGGLAGTDFLAAPKAVRTIAAGNSQDFIAAFTFDTPTEIAEIQSMLDNPAANFGWMFLSNREDQPKTVRRFSTKDTLTQDAAALAKRPTLTVEFTPPGAPSPPTDFAITFAPDGSRSLTFTREAGATYEIESSTSLRQADWTSFSTVPTSTTSAPFSLPLATPLLNRQFFRISAQ